MGNSIALEQPQLQGKFNISTHMGWQASQQSQSPAAIWTGRPEAAVDFRLPRTNPPAALVINRPVELP